MMYPQRQQTWGWLAAIYVFSAGLGGGVFLFSFILNTAGRYESVARIGALSGPLLAWMGTLFLLGDLGSVTRAHRLFASPSAFVTSWMARGVWILTGFIIFGLAYALPSFRLFTWLPWTHTSTLGQGMGLVAALLSILMTVYPGFLLGVLNSIPFWNTPALPLLFFLSGLDTGIALLIMIALFFPGSFGAEGFHLLGTADMALLFLLLITLGGYLEIVRQTGSTSAASVRLLKTPLFIGGVIILGLLLPLGLLLYSLSITHLLSLRVFSGIISTFVLAGGLCLRYSIIRGGVRLAVR